MGRADGVAGQGDDFAAKGLGAGAFLADVLAFARRERGEEGVKIFVAVVEPMELLAGAMQEAHLTPGLGFGGAAKGEVQGGEAVVGRDLHRALDQGGLACGLVARTGEQAAACDRGKGHGNLQFRVVASACGLVGVGPVVIEDIFAWLWI